MSVHDTHGKRSRRKRERVVALLVALFPLFVASGFLAPGWVRIMAFARTVDDSERASVVDRIGPYGRRPLLVPRDFSAGFVPELLDLDQLFLGTQSRIDPSAHRVARVSAFDRSYGDAIVFDSVSPFREPIEFADALMEEQQQQVLGDASQGAPLPLCGTLHAANCVRDDDFTGALLPKATPIPEPHTGALLALGLGLLAWRRPRRV
jgi:hypothetical protein